MSPPATAAVVTLLVVACVGGVAYLANNQNVNISSIFGDSQKQNLLQEIPTTNKDLSWSSSTFLKNQKKTYKAGEQELSNEPTKTDTNTFYLPINQNPAEEIDVTQLESLQLGDFFSKLYPGRSIFEILGAYESDHDRKDVNSYPGLSWSYGPSMVGLKINNNYCHESDMWRINNPKNVFEEMHVMTAMTYSPDFNIHDAAKRMGATMNRYSDWFSGRHNNTMANETNMMIVQHFDVYDIAFFTKAFGCITQSYNHHTGSYLTKKYFIPPMVNLYAEKHKGKPEKCFKKDDISPPTYRLANKKQCIEFFNILLSAEYKERLKVNPNQYIIKPGSDSVQGDGIFLLDAEHTVKLQQEFGVHGERCGKASNYIAQLYLANPLLIKGKKFDFRIFLSVISENPLIATYQDGYIRKSLFKYDPNSHDNKQHLTNNFFAEEALKKMKQTGETMEGMTYDEVAKDSIWTLEEFRDYLLETGQISDPKWLENYLRPQFKKIMLHVMKMLQGNYAKNSQTFDWYGFDFMMTDDMKVWLIELNDYPAFHNLREDEGFVKQWVQRFNIQLAFYRSRMKRVFNLLKNMRTEYAEHGFIEIGKYKRRFGKANENKLEPEYVQMADQTGFEPVIDESRKGADRYFGLIDPECILDDDA